jgi:ubiquinone/menaquinone biosynthesis C-methylase UbiE
VTSTDYVPALLEKAARRAAADGLSIEFRHADAEQLPFEDRSFDVAMSTFGVMFAPNQERAARELARVVRPGGRIGLASWRPDGFIGELFRVIGRFAPPPAGLRSPAQWGMSTRLAELFASARALSHETRTFTFRYQSARHWIEMFRAFYGPMHMAFASLDLPQRHKLEEDLFELLSRHDIGRGRGLVVPATYLETVILN